MSKFLTVLFIFCTFYFAKAGEPDTSKIEFKGKDVKVSYLTQREIGEVEYTIKNNTDKEIKLKLVGAFVVRGKFADPLQGGKIKVFYQGKYRKMKYLVVKPNEEVEFTVFFDPFKIYTGSKYAVRTILQLENGKRIKAEVNIDLYKQNIGDKNRMKEKEEGTEIKKE